MTSIGPCSWISACSTTTRFTPARGNRVLREAGYRFTDDEFEEEYTRARTEQSGVVPSPARRALPAGGRPPRARGRRRSCTTRPPRSTRTPSPVSRSCAMDGFSDCELTRRGPSAMRRDGLDRFFEVGVSDELGVGKPDPRSSSSPRARPASSHVRRHGRGSARLRRVPSRSWSACARSGCSAARRPTGLRPNNSTRRTGRSLLLAELPGELYRLSAA